MVKLLEVNNLEVVFNTKDGIVQAVNKISYSMNRSEILGIVGESGSGKSVSAMSILRLLPQPPAKILNGEILFEGTDLLKIPQSQLYDIRGRDIAMVFQDPMTSLNPVLTIGYQIEEAIKINLQVSKEEARHRTIEVLSQVGIPHAAKRLNDYPPQFSGGMRQRVVIAMAISCKPKLLIADEPTTALDVTIQAQIVDLVKQLQQNLQMAVIWITHDLAVVSRLASRINVMYAGTIVEMGPIRSIFKNTYHPSTRGLLNSIPKASLSRSETLKYIEGAPPDMVHLPVGCPFAPRCDFVTDHCKESRPILTEVDTEHFASCWNLDTVRNLTMKK